MADGVELAERQVVEHAPVRGAVPARGHAPVAPQNQVVRVRRVDPEVVVIDVHLGGAVAPEGAPAVVRHHQRAPEHVDAVHVGRVDAHVRVVHRARVGVRHLLPRVPAVERTEEPAPRRPSAPSEALARCPRLGLDQRVHDVPVPAEDIHPDASLVAIGESLGQFRPGVAPVQGAVEPAPRSAPVEAPPGAPPLVHPREDGVGVARVHRHVDGAGVLIDIEDPLPALAPVLRPEDPALLVGPPQIADRRDVHDIRIARMDEDAPDVLAPLEPHVPPGLPAVDRLVDAVPPARRLPVLRLPGADPDQVRIRLVERDGSDGARRLIVEERRPGSAVVLGLPDPSRARAYIEDLRLRLHHRDVRDAPTHERRPELAILEMRDGRLERGLGMRVPGGEQGGSRDHGAGERVGEEAASAPRG